MNVWMMCVTVLLSAWTPMVGLSAHVTQDTQETDSTALVRKKAVSPAVHNYLCRY